MKVSQIRLSSNDVMMEYDWVNTRLWRKITTCKFEFCSSTCEYSKEHAYKFDGQIFFRKKSNER